MEKNLNRMRWADMIDDGIEDLENNDPEHAHDHGAFSSIYPCADNDNGCTTHSTALPSSSGEDVSVDRAHYSCNGWHSQWDHEHGGMYFVKLIDRDTGLVFRAENAEKLRMIALDHAKAPNYEKGRLYFLQTRIRPQLGNNGRCKRHADKWSIGKAQRGDHCLRYFRDS